MGKVAPILQRETPREVGAHGSQRMGALGEREPDQGTIAAGTSCNTRKSRKARETTEHFATYWRIGRGVLCGGVLAKGV